MYFFQRQGIVYANRRIPGFSRNSPSYYWDSPAADRKITELKGGFSEVIRSFSGLLRRIPEMLRSLPEKHGNFPGSDRKIPGLFSRLSEEHRGIPVQRSNLPGGTNLCSKYPGVSRTVQRILWSVGRD